jgi:hypothetical protein
MSISNGSFYLKRLFLYLSVTCGISGVMISDTAYSQTNSRVYLRVTAPRGTYFKREINWYRQSPDILFDGERCYVGRNQEFLVSSIRPLQGIQPVRENDLNSEYFGNIEYPGAYWEVTFQNPIRCSDQQNADTGPWYIYRRHVQQVRR